MTTQFIPYSCQSIAEEDIDAVGAVLRSEYVTQGPLIPQFERMFAEIHRTAHAVAVTNATAGLHIGCLALGVGPGSRVWTSPNSFLASANCALYCGASVDFVDIDPLTRNMSVNALAEKLQRARRAGSLPDLLIPVDFSGLACDLRELRGLADDFGFKILEDASHATGASYLGDPVGSRYADATVFSFHAVKIITTAEGGMVVTGNAQTARQLQLLRSHGMTRDPAEFSEPAHGPWYYEQQCLGYNYRMTELQAALGISQLKRLDEMRRQRFELVCRYRQLLEGLPLLLPVMPADRESSWHLYVVEIDDARTSVSRATVLQALRDARIGANVHYIPIHLQPFYAKLGFRAGDFPAAERYYSRAVSLPLFPELTEAQQQRVVDVLRRALGS